MFAKLNRDKLLLHSIFIKWCPEREFPMFASSIGINFSSYSFLVKWCPERESNPHAPKNTWPSTMPVYQFQHPGLDVECESIKSWYNVLFIL